MRNVTIQEGFIPVSQGRAWYRVAQTAEGAPLLMLHGGTVAASGYFPPLLSIAEERPVVLYDQLGGQHLGGLQDSAASTAGDDGTGFRRFLRDVEQAQAVLPAPRMHVLGHSWGAPLALEYALHCPGWVLSLIVDLVEPPLRDRRALQPGRAGFSMVEKLADLSRSGRLAQIKVPALLICGRQADCLPELTDWYQGLLPGAELLALHRRMGAHSPEESAQLFRMVRDFLRRAEGKAGLAADVPPLALAA